MNYNIDHFINKVKTAQPNSFCTGDLRNKLGQSCINGSCMGTSRNPSIRTITQESMALQELFGVLIIHDMDGDIIEDSSENPYYSLKAAYVNNGDCLEYQQPTIEERLLASFYDIKAIQELQTGNLMEANNILSSSVILDKVNVIQK